jgi:hypothetical protein
VEVHEFCAQALVAAPETLAYLPSERRCCFYESLPRCAPVEGAVSPQPGGLLSEGGGPIVAPVSKYASTLRAAIQPSLFTPY